MSGDWPLAELATKQPTNTNQAMVPLTFRIRMTCGIGERISDLAWEAHAP
jgi:hypothetical protein